MSDQIIEQRLQKFVRGLQQEHYELLHKYGYADFKLEENPVDGYEKEALWLSGVYETELLQLLNEARIETEIRAYKHGLMTGSLPEALGKPIAKDYIAKLTPKENK